MSIESVDPIIIVIGQEEYGTWIMGKLDAIAYQNLFDNSSLLTLWVDRNLMIDVMDYP